MYFIYDVGICWLSPRQRLGSGCSTAAAVPPPGLRHGAGGGFVPRRVQQLQHLGTTITTGEGLALATWRFTA